VDAVVVEPDVLSHRMGAIRCDAVNGGDDTFPPLADLDALWISGRPHRSLRRSFGFLDYVSIGIGFDSEPL
jgi:hypothetical protein